MHRTFEIVIPGITVQVEVSKIVSATGIKNSQNYLENIKTHCFPFKS